MAIILEGEAARQFLDKLEKDRKYRQTKKGKDEVKKERERLKALWDECVKNGVVKNL